jgi:hypothetical protein
MHYRRPPVMLFNAMKSVLALALLAFAGALGGQAAEDLEAVSEAAPAIQLTATLISPTAIELKWAGTEPNAAGRIVEWTADPNADYVTLAFLWPNITRFMHADVAPLTTCHYRVRPYFGPASEVVEITTGKAPPDGLGISFDETWADPKTTPAGAVAETSSIRNAATVAEAAPTDLKAALVHPTGILLTWVDHASDEDGYLLELKLDDTSGFQVRAIVEPNITSFGYALVPPETKAAFRVRAFHYGESSNPVNTTTGFDPTFTR